MRDHTPRHHDAARNELVVDFVLHGDGPASRWAEHATLGQHLGAGGPRGSFVVARDFDRYVLAGDETALPAIGRWLEEMPAGTQAEVLLEIPDARDRQSLTPAAHVDVTWLERDGEAPGKRLERALRSLPAGTGDTLHWIATESRRARAMRRFLADERGLPKEWIRATGNWTRTAANRSSNAGMRVNPP